MIKTSGTHLAHLADVELECKRALENELNCTHRECGDELSHDCLTGEVNYEWLMSKRLATESRLSLSWPGSGFNPAQGHSQSAFTLLQQVNFGALNPTQTCERSELSTHNTFSVSAYGAFVIACSGSNILVYSPRQSRDSLQLNVRIDSGARVLAVSMDTSSGRTTLAALLDDRIGMAWELGHFLGMESVHSKRGENMDLGMRAEVRSSDSVHSTLSTTRISHDALGISSRTLSKPERSAELTKATSGFQRTSLCNLGSAQHPPLHVVHDEDRLPVSLSSVSPTPSAIYTNIGTTGDEPRTVAVCPERKCVAFGCGTGIELHWIDMLTGSSLNRWFPIATPSDYLYFLPQQPHVDPTRKLRMISSAARPYTENYIREAKPEVKWTYRMGGQGQSRLRSMTRLFLNHSPAPPAQPDDPTRRDEIVRHGVERTVECDHYQAIPVSDGVHMLFTDPTTGLLCLGSDAPIGAPVKLIRKACMVPPSTCSTGPIFPLSCYRAAQELRWGVRIVAAYEDGGVVLYNIPSDCFEHIRYIKSSPEMWIPPEGEFSFGSPESPIIVDMPTGERRSSSGLRYMDCQADSSEPSESSSPRAYVRCLEVQGREIHRSKSRITDIQVNCAGGGIKIWLFTQDNRATQIGIYAPRWSVVRQRYADGEGMIHDVEAEQDEEGIRRGNKKCHEPDEVEDDGRSRQVKFKV